MGDPRFEKFTPAEILEHLIIMTLNNDKNVELVDGVLSITKAGEYMQSEHKTAAAVTTGDPVIDRWERMIAAGIDPFSKENRAATGEG